MSSGPEAADEEAELRRRIQQSMNSQVKAPQKENEATDEEAELRRRIQQSLNSQVETPLKEDEAELRVKIQQSLKSQYVTQLESDGGGMPGQMFHSLGGGHGMNIDAYNVMLMAAMQQQQQQFQYQVQGHHSMQQQQFLNLPPYVQQTQSPQCQFRQEEMQPWQQFPQMQQQPVSCVASGGKEGLALRQRPSSENKSSKLSLEDMKQKLAEEKNKVARPISCDTNGPEDNNNVPIERSLVSIVQQSLPLTGQAQYNPIQQQHHENRFRGPSNEELKKLVELEQKKLEARKQGSNVSTEHGQKKRASNKGTRFSGLSTEELKKMVELEQKKLEARKQGSNVVSGNKGNSLKGLGPKGEFDPKSPKQPILLNKEVAISPSQSNREESELRTWNQQSLHNQCVGGLTAEDNARVMIDTSALSKQAGASYREGNCQQSDEHSAASLSYNSLSCGSIAIFQEEDVVGLDAGWKMSEWIQHQKLNAKDKVSESKQYFERSLHIIHSLVLSMTAVVDNDDEELEIRIALDPSLITVENILVQCSDGQESAHFIQTVCEADSNLDDVITKYDALKALGIVAYNLFMRGSGPAVSSFVPLASDNAAELQLIIEDSENSPVPKQAESKRRRSTDDKKGTITTAMIDGGVPFPLCRFVVDLLGGEGSDGVLFRRDDSFQSFSDVIVEIEEFQENPEAYVHLSAKDQWRLNFSEKLMGREREKKMFMDVALQTLATPSQQQVVLVYGAAGSGKSRLVSDTLKSLESQGWNILCCKFDRTTVAEPLSIMVHAFNVFLGQCLGNSIGHQVRAQLKKLDHHDIMILARHIPCLFKYAEDCNSFSEVYDVTEEQIQYLFKQLLKAISEVGPLAFFADDLQWAEIQDFALFLSFTTVNEPDLSSNGIARTKGESKVLLIGSYRDTDGDSNYNLIQMLSQLKISSSTEVTSIPVRGFDSETLNEVVSDALCLPRRKTKGLSEIILQKTGGMVMHIIEFIARLTTERMLCHSFVKGWQFEKEVIEECPISESVAELFAFKLKNLPPDVLLGLQICSIFGIQIEQRVIDFIQDFDGEDTVDINAGLKAVLELGLVESTGNAFKISHDLIQESALDLIEEDQRSQLLQKLASSLIKNASAAGAFESVVFVAVDLINRITNDDIDSEKRLLYATMNEEAARRALAVPDFHSAVKYSESGLKFLEILGLEALEKTHHKLMLSMFQTNVEAMYSSIDCNQDLLKERISVVFRYAATLEEEFKTRDIYIMLIGKTDTSEVILQSHDLLVRLGEPIDPSMISPGFAASELVRIKNSFQDKKHMFTMMSFMTDQTKLNTMKICTNLLGFYHRTRSHIGAVVCTRMLEIAMQYGFCEDAVFAIAAFAAFVVTFLGDVDEGCSWGRLALALVRKARHNVNALLSTVYSVIYGFVLVLREPFQATLDPILQACRLGFESGNLQYAIGSAHIYVSRAFHCGTNIDVVLGDIEVMTKKCMQHDLLIFAQSVLAPVCNMLRGLKGLDEEVLVQCTTTQDDHIYVELQLVLDIFSSFLFSNFEKSQQMAEKFKDHVEGKAPTFQYIITNFYAALTACYFARTTGDASQIVKAEGIRDMMHKLIAHSKWNFENKWLLLKAECHYSRGEISEATECYQASITSARNHKFVNEEAVALERAGYFFKEQGDKTKSIAMFAQAHDAYKKWGADEKARTLSMYNTRSSSSLSERWKDSTV